MMLSHCTREEEVADVLKQGQWPTACTPELRSHLSACRSCSDLALVAGSFQRARVEATGEAPIPSPGTIWWRAQLRRRNAAVERLGRPILGAQIFALAINLAVLVGLLATQARHGMSWLTRLEQLPEAYSLHFEDLWTTALLNPGWGLMVMIPAGAALALLSGVIVYLATD
jgi:hypothetical protein